MKIIILVLLLCGVGNAEVVREISNLITRDNVNSRVGINLASGADPTVTLDVNGTGIFSNTGASSLDIGGGLNAGTGNVAIIDATGKIPALSSTYLDNLSGANLTALTAANISAGSLGASVIASSITLAAMYGSPTFSTLTVTGNAFSVGTSTLVVTQGWLGVGLTPTVGVIEAKDTYIMRLVPNTAAAGEMLAGPQIHTDDNLVFRPTTAGTEGKTLQLIYWDGGAWKSALEYSHSTGGNPTNLVLMKSGGKVGIGAASPDSKLHISSGTLKLDGTGALFNISVSSTIITATDTCVKGDIRWDASYIFVCTDTNAWERAALASW